MNSVTMQESTDVENVHSKKVQDYGKITIKLKLGNISLIQNSTFSRKNLFNCFTTLYTHSAPSEKSNRPDWPVSGKQRRNERTLIECWQSNLWSEILGSLLLLEHLGTKCSFLQRNYHFIFIKNELENKSLNANMKVSANSIKIY